MVYAMAMAVAAVAAGSARSEDAGVYVVTVLASDRHKNVDPRVAGIADEVKKKDPSLTGFRVEKAAKLDVPLNQKKAFDLVGDVKAEITVLSCDDKDKKARLTVKCPHFGEVTYTTVTEKYFPVLTRYQTEKDKERLIFAVMVKPVSAKDKEKEKTPDAKE
jgi:hypothetical protein